jgi:hypothetical protein
MLKRPSLFLLAALLIFTPSNSWAQKKHTAEVDTVKVNFFNGIAVHAELIGAIQMIASDHGQLEAGLRLNLKDRYFPAFEIGIGKADEKDEYIDDSWFKTRAPYFRIGCDYNILRNKHDPYKAFVGLRYGFSRFDYDTTVGKITQIEDDPATEEDESSTETTYTDYKGLNGTYHWLEAVFGVDAKIWGPLHLGWDVRYRRALTNKHSDVAEPWYIPGFGNKKTAGFTATFNLTFNI